MLRLGIHGYGRIGRTLLRVLYQSRFRQQMQVVIINELADLDAIYAMTRSDTTYGQFSGPVSQSTQGLDVCADSIRVTHETQIQQVPWQAYDVDMIIDCTGTEQQVSQSVDDIPILFAYPTEVAEKTIIYGVNHNQIDGHEQRLSCGSCSMHCLIPILTLLNDSLGIEALNSTTIHAAMSGQPIIDTSSQNRSERSALVSLLPTKTHLATHIEQHIPALSGHVTSTHVRVPTLSVSAMTATMLLKTGSTVQQINLHMLAASQQQDHAAIVEYFDSDTAASIDFHQNTHSVIFDAQKTQLSQNQLLTIWLWFDNEWAYVHRMLETMRHIDHLLAKRLS